jgi:glutaredoxin 3
MYSKWLCPYCARAKRTLAELGLNPEVKDITFKPSLRRQMIERTGRHTVPQIFIDGRHIGGSDDLEAARESGLLCKLINEK